MKAIYVATAIFALISIAYISRPNELTLQDNLDTQKEFFDYIISFGKRYVDNSEFGIRYSNFRKSLEIVRAHNSKNEISYTMGINQFSDWNQQEIDIFLTLKVDNNEEGVKNYAPKSGVSAPTSVDWRTQGVLNPIKDQGSCGSCWAFSAIGAFEAAFKQLTGELRDFSEQLLVDCNRGTFIFGNQGCNGGLMNTAYDWMKTNNAALTADFPYVAKDQTCNKSYKQFSAKVKSYVIVAENDDALREAIALQPVAVAIQANQDSFMKYQDGIIDNCADTRLDHGIIAVGYGVENGKQYYVIRNSWGPRWGDQGHAKIAADKTSCGIRQKASYPIATR